jgi:hypothetical protein
LRSKLPEAKAHIETVGNGTAAQGHLREENVGQVPILDGPESDAGVGELVDDDIRRKPLALVAVVNCPLDHPWGTR